ncbi:arrestin domain-containing 3-like [Brachionus plicatilis]|uniref:Arrestin domain-containing 3-like n=1 Tax=Brachionus plicatilis TaxID=10195 RepID=A0A3M7SQH1_BRAPC|nr:arrestin domain-containing 3-like [Brachionus plicatilis]
MSNFEYFSIELDRHNSFYLSGENLKGSIKIKLTEKEKINSIKVYLNGGAYVKWNGTLKGGGGGYATEKYVDSIVTLLSKLDNSDLYLQDKEYNFDFEFLLPHDLPSSFESSIGQIRYFLTAVIEREWMYDKKVKLNLSVKSVLDLNKNPVLRQGYGVCEQKEICCGPCKSDSIVADFSTKKCGFVLGEQVEFKVKIQNRSNRKINHTKVALRQNIVYHADHNKTWITDDIQSVFFQSSIQPLENMAWENGDIQIPLLAQTLTGRIIEITYSLVLSFKASASLSKNIAIPIVVGLIPFN